MKKKYCGSKKSCMSLKAMSEKAVAKAVAVMKELVAKREEPVPPPPPPTEEEVKREEIRDWLKGIKKGSRLTMSGNMKTLKYTYSVKVKNLKTKKKRIERVKISFKYKIDGFKSHSKTVKYKRGKEFTENEDLLRRLEDDLYDGYASLLTTTRNVLIVASANTMMKEKNVALEAIYNTGNVLATLLLIKVFIAESQNMRKRFPQTLTGVTEFLRQNVSQLRGMVFGSREGQRLGGGNRDESQPHMSAGTVAGLAVQAGRAAQNPASDEKKLGYRDGIELLRELTATSELEPHMREAAQERERASEEKKFNAPYKASPISVQNVKQDDIELKKKPDEFEAASEEPLFVPGERETAPQTAAIDLPFPGAASHRPRPLPHIDLPFPDKPVKRRAPPAVPGVLELPFPGAPGHTHPPLPQSMQLPFPGTPPATDPLADVSSVDASPRRSPGGESSVLKLPFPGAPGHTAPPLPQSMKLPFPGEGTDVGVLSEVDATAVA